MNLYKLHNNPNLLYGYTNLPEAFHFDHMNKELERYMTSDLSTYDTRWFINNIKEYDSNPEFDAEILKTSTYYDDSYLLYMYSTEVMEAPWPEAEDTIRNDSLIWMSYMEKFYPEEAAKYDKLGNPKE